MSLRDELRSVKAERDFWEGEYRRYEKNYRGMQEACINAVGSANTAEEAAAEAHPYIHLAEDLLTLIPSLNQYVCTCEESTGWDFEAISRAAEHKRNRDELEAFEAIVGVEQ